MLRIQDTAEYKRLHTSKGAWQRWGPYLSNRQWGTVRENYSTSKSTWAAFSYDDAKSTVYRWGEDGILGISDDTQTLCFSIALWNGKDSHVKERFFGMSGMLGNNHGVHGEDVKEYYFYLDATPTHSYMKALYKYPVNAFPYEKLIEKNEERRDRIPRDPQERNRSAPEQEYELIDTEVFDDGYFDVYVEYAKADPDDLLIQISISTVGLREDAELCLLPTLWFRNTWSWKKDNSPAPYIVQGDGILEAHHTGSSNADMYLHYEKSKEDFGAVCLTENQSRQVPEDFKRPEEFRPASIENGFYKDSIHCYVMGSSQSNPVTEKRRGTKASIYYRKRLKPTEEWTIRLRLSAKQQMQEYGFSDFEECMRTRREEAEQFYEALMPSTSPVHSLQEKWADWREIQRRALAGLIWSKQYYFYDVDTWRAENPRRQDNPNDGWSHIGKLGKPAIICVPDKWEYPYFAAWDLAFQAVPMALVDPEFAKEQLCLLIRPEYMRFDGQIPGCEFGFQEANPPLHAWAAVKVYNIEKEIYHNADKNFLRTIANGLWQNFMWWTNTKKMKLAYWVWDEPPNQRQRKKMKNERASVSAGFLGLDNISIIDRNSQTDHVRLEEVDAIAWVAMYCINMIEILSEIEDLEPHHERVQYCLEEFVALANELNTQHRDGGECPFWDCRDGFYYEILRLSPEDHSFTVEVPLKYRSVLGLLPLCAVGLFTKPTNCSELLRSEVLDELFDERGQFRKPMHKEWDYMIGHEENIKVCLPQEEHQFELFLALVGWQKLTRVLEKMLDEDEFLSRFGIRSLSKHHARSRYGLDGMITNRWGERIPIEVNYEPGETNAPIHVGNSNWRGPIWFPVNYLLIDALKKYDAYLQRCGYHDTRVAFPSRTENCKAVGEVASALSERLISIFALDKQKNRPVHGYNEKIRDQFGRDKWNDCILFFEHFNGDNGAGLGASHQTGWTALVANLIDETWRANTKSR